MNFVTILKYTQLLGLVTLALTPSSHAFDLSLLKNDKEAKSHAYDGIEKRMAVRSMESFAERAYSLLGETLTELEKNKGVCDFNLYQSFTSRLDLEKIPSSPRSFLNLLIVWRSQNLIDDIFFEIMEQVSNLNAAIDSSSLDKVKNREVSRAEKLLTGKNISNQDLSVYYQGFKSYSIGNPGCTISAWTRAATQLAAIEKRNDTVRLVNVAAHSRSIINDEEFKLVEFYRTNDIQSWDITLSKYLNIMKSVKNKSRGPNPRDDDFKPNSLSSRFRDKHAGITYRQNLYYRFNSTQINMISELMKKTFTRMDATKTEVVFTFKDGSETLPVSPMGQYFLARKLLRKDMMELSRSSFFAGVPVTHEDLVTAALETGLINNDVLDSVLKIDDLWNPVVKPWKKVTDYAFRVSGTASIFLPPPYNIISSIALVFIDGFINRKTTKSNQADNSYDFF